MMAAPSSIPRDLHLAREPRRQTATAQSREKANRKLIQCTTFEKLRSLLPVVIVTDLEYL